MATFSQILVQFFITALIKGQKGPKYGTWIAQKERIKSHTVAFICFMQDPGIVVHCAADVCRRVMLLLCCDQSKLL